MSDETKVGDCECCGFEDVPVKPYRRTFPDESIRDLCDVCAGSLISTATAYNYQNEMLYRSLGYCTNLILKAIKDAAR